MGRVGDPVCGEKSSALGTAYKSFFWGGHRPHTPKKGGILDYFNISGFEDYR